MRHPLAIRHKANRLVLGAISRTNFYHDDPFILKILDRILRISRYRLNSSSKYICNEIIQYAFDVIKVPLFKKKRINTITPKDLLSEDCLLYIIEEVRPHGKDS